MARVLRWGLVIAIVAAIVWTCGGTLCPQGRSRGTERLTIYGFSILAEPLQDEVFPLFRREWRALTGRDVAFDKSFAASGTIANQIIDGTHADIAIFSHPGDADRVVARGRATTDWRKLPNGGILNRTPIVIAVRAGNPKGIRSYADLGRPGMRIIHPDPLTSGGAQWAVMAEYAEPLMLARAAGRPGSPELAYAQLVDIWRNVVAQAPSARAARTQFDQGFGDALVTYEVELLLDRRRGRPLDAVIPETTIVTEHPIVVVDQRVSPARRALIDAFVEFLGTEPAQRAFLRYGFRSVLPGLDAENTELATIRHAYTVADLGGWTKAQREIVELAWKGRALAEARR